MSMVRIECPVSRNAVSSPDGIAVIEGENRFTYKELNRKIIASKNLLELRGINSGMQVGVIAFNGVLPIVLYLSLMRMGAVPVPVNPRFPPDEIRKIISLIGLDALIAEHPNEISDLRIPVLETGAFDIPADMRIFSEKEKFFSGKGMIFLTSGSTGDPKGVLLSPQNLFYNALGANMNMTLHSGDRWLLILPLFHVGGMGILFRTFISGATVVIPHVRTLPVGDSINETAATHVSMVSTQLEDYVSSLEENDSRAPAHLKAVLTGGGMVPDSLVIRALKRGIPVFKTYGLTEMASQVTTTGSPVSEHNISSSGKALEYREISVSGTGRIRVKGACLFQGYVTGGRLHLPKLESGGWFPTGDCGEISGSGDLHVTGRSDNMFISGGENIFPEEIEKELMKMNGIVNAVVVPISDERYGMRPAVFIQTKGKDLKKRDIDHFLRRSLPGFKVPDRYFYLPPMEQGKLKIDRKKLKALLDEGTELEMISD